MRILNIGGATAVLEHNGKTMLFDPWMDEGIFHGAWYHYPPSKIHIEDLGHIDYVYISHIHEDHCSPETISQLNDDAEIIIMDQKPNFVAKFLDNHKFRFKKIHLIKPKTPIEIAPNLIVDMLEGDPLNPMAHAIDSTLILKWDKHTILNANDCAPYQAGIDYILDTCDKIDLALLPYGGGSGYPACYANLSSQEKEQERDRIIAMRLESFVANVNKLKPKNVIPFADQYIVVGSQSHLNKYISHPVCPGILEDYIKNRIFESNLILLNSGQRYDFTTQEKIPCTPYQHFSESERESYLQSLSNIKYDHEHFNLNPSVSLDKLVMLARNKLWNMQKLKEYFPHYTLILEASDMQKRFKISFALEYAEEVSYFEKCTEPYLRISVSGTLLMLLLIGHISWNIADAALFLDYERKPNVYDGKIYEFLNYLKV